MSTEESWTLFKTTFLRSFLSIHICLHHEANHPILATRCQKLIEVVDEHKIRIFYEKRMRPKLEADPRIERLRTRKSVRGCIVDGNLSVLALVIVCKGEQEIPGLTDNQVPRRLGPKRALRIRKLYNLSKEDDVRQYLIKRLLPLKEGKTQRFKAPKIQMLITPSVLQ
ncbi:RpS6 [Trypoxylus dichotomus]